MNEEAKKVYAFVIAITKVRGVSDCEPQIFHSEKVRDYEAFLSYRKLCNEENKTPLLTRSEFFSKVQKGVSVTDGIMIKAFTLSVENFETLYGAAVVLLNDERKISKVTDVYFWSYKSEEERDRGSYHFYDYFFRRFNLGEYDVCGRKRTLMKNPFSEKTKQSMSVNAETESATVTAFTMKSDYVKYHVVS